MEHLGRVGHVVGTGQLGTEVQHGDGHEQADDSADEGGASTHGSLRPDQSSGPPAT